MAAEIDVQLKEKGWYINTEGIEECMQELGQRDKTLENVIKWAVNCDLKEVGSTIITEEVKRGQVQSVEGPLVLQIQKIRNISAPKANEESGAAPRLLKLQLTDGHTTVFGLENSLIQKLSLSTPPGTKIRIKGTVPLLCGFMLLEPRHVEVLGGKVEKLVLKWETNKTVSQQRAKPGMPSDDGPPLFIVFDPKTSNCIKKTSSLNLENKRNKNPWPNQGSGTSQKEETKKIRGPFEDSRDQRIQTAKQSKENQSNPTKIGRNANKSFQVAENQGGRPAFPSERDQTHVEKDSHVKPKDPQQESFGHNQSNTHFRDGRFTNKNDGQHKYMDKNSYEKRSGIYKGGRHDDDVDDVHSTSRPSEGTLWDFLETKLPSKGSGTGNISGQSCTGDRLARAGNKDIPQPSSQRYVQYKTQHPNQWQREHRDQVQNQEVPEHSENSENNENNQFRSQQKHDHQTKDQHVNQYGKQRGRYDQNQYSKQKNQDREKMDNKRENQRNNPPSRTGHVDKPGKQQDARHGDGKSNQNQYSKEKEQYREKRDDKRDNQRNNPPSRIGHFDKPRKQEDAKQGGDGKSNQNQYSKEKEQCREKRDDKRDDQRNNPPSGTEHVDKSRKQQDSRHGDGKSNQNQYSKEKEQDREKRDDKRDNQRNNPPSRTEHVDKPRKQQDARHGDGKSNQNQCSKAKEQDREKRDDKRDNQRNNPPSRTEHVDKPRKQQDARHGDGKSNQNQYSKEKEQDREKRDDKRDNQRNNPPSRTEHVDKPRKQQDARHGDGKSNQNQYSKEKEQDREKRDDKRDNQRNNPPSRTEHVDKPRKQQDAKQGGDGKSNQNQYGKEKEQDREKMVDKRDNQRNNPPWITERVGKQNNQPDARHGGWKPNQNQNSKARELGREKRDDERTNQRNNSPSRTERVESQSRQQNAEHGGQKSYQNQYRKKKEEDREKMDDKRDNQRNYLQSRTEQVEKQRQSNQSGNQCEKDGERGNVSSQQNNKTNSESRGDYPRNTDYGKSENGTKRQQPARTRDGKPNFRNEASDVLADHSKNESKIVQDVHVDRGGTWEPGKNQQQSQGKQKEYMYFERNARGDVRQYEDTRLITNKGQENAGKRVEWPRYEEMENSSQQTERYHNQKYSEQSEKYSEGVAGGRGYRTRRQHWWREGEDCMAFRLEHSQYHLARIIKVEVPLKSCVVIFHDTGKQETINWSNMIQLDTQPNNEHPYFYQQNPFPYTSPVPMQGGWMQQQDPFAPQFYQARPSTTGVPAVQYDVIGQRSQRPTQAFYRPPGRNSVD